MADISNTTLMSRRSALAGAVAALVPVPAGAAVAASEPDTMVEAIEASRRHYARPEWETEDGETGPNRLNELADKYDAAVMAASVTSFAGAIAALELVQSNIDEDIFSDDFDGHLLAEAIRFLKAGGGNG